MQAMKLNRLTSLQDSQMDFSIYCINGKTLKSFTKFLIDLDCLWTRLNEIQVEWNLDERFRRFYHRQSCLWTWSNRFWIMWRRYMRKEFFFATNRWWILPHSETSFKFDELMLDCRHTCSSDSKTLRLDLCNLLYLSLKCLRKVSL